MPRSTVPVGYVEPMLPTLVDEAPEGDGWIHEVKYDGYRTELAIAGKTVQAFTRNGRDWTAKYGPVISAASTLKCSSALIDGEMCVQNDKGVTDFRALRRSLKGAPDRLVLFAFDLIMLDGRDLRSAPLVDRRELLRTLIGSDPAARIQFSGDHAGQGSAFFRAADAHGLEGIVSKRPDSRYVGGRSTSWLKIKSFTVADYSVLGVERSKTGIPVALLASLGKGAAYVGDAMVTLKDKDRTKFWADVEKLGTPRSRLAGTLAKRKAAWVKEGLVARVRHLRGEDKLRHASVQSIGPKGSSDDIEQHHFDDE